METLSSFNYKVDNARIVQNFDYVEEIFQTYLKTSKDDLDDAASRLRRMTPAPMNTMLEKQPRGEAIKKRDKRKSLVVADVPPTTPVSQATASTTKKTAPRRPAKSNADSTAPSRRPKKRSNADSTAASGIPAKKALRNKASSTKKTKKGSNASRKRQKK